ncbi:DUF1622 domain-containing protein [Proteinivorax hydrogeniformans]|uniref:DUF1622 domain-containing protein n=1 Tax=Proteinivorax hydrogeniformans TaxID=1826727 RepID=A0AAU8HRD0_9FIRM
MDTTHNIIFFLSILLEWFAALVIVAVSIIVLTGYIFSLFKPAEKLRLSLARGLALGLEFALAGEILRTILIRELEELFILGAIIILRAALSVLIHWEISHTVNCLQSECEIHEEDKTKNKANLNR